MKHGPTSPALIKQPKREERKPVLPKTKTPQQENTEAERVAGSLNKK